MMRFYGRSFLVVALLVGIWWVLFPAAVEKDARGRLQPVSIHNYVGGYHHLWYGLTGDKVAAIQAVQAKGMTVEERYAAKLGEDFNFLKYIARVTPEDAILRMPPNEKWQSGEKKFRHIPGKGKAWLSFFLYPRTLLFEQEANYNPDYELLTKQATHVVVVDGWGYHLLPHLDSSKHVPYGVAPISTSL